MKKIYISTIIFLSILISTLLCNVYAIEGTSQQFAYNSSKTLKYNTDISLIAPVLIQIPDSSTINIEPDPN